MTLETLRLFNFRNFRELDVRLDGRSVAIWGPNGRGKTNLLESVFLLAATRSHRTRRDSELVRFGESGYSVAGGFRRDGGGTTSVALVYQEGSGKRGSVDGKETERLSSLVGRCGVVFVSPEDVEITRGEPERRRHFLDLTLCTLSPVYLRSLQEYNKVLRQRGRLLREAHGPDAAALLDTWDRQLARWAMPILSLRRETVGEIGPVAEEVYGELGGGETLRVAYRPGASAEECASEESLMRRLAANRAGDLRTGRTSVGPHRDDMDVLLDGKAIRNFGSRGQHRTAVLAFKIAAGRLLGEKMGEAPILLLDDVFTELDERRSAALSGLLRREGQVFAVGTDRGGLKDHFPAAAAWSIGEEGRLVLEG